MAASNQRLEALSRDPVRSYADLIEQQVSMARSKTPSAFRLRAQMLAAGRSETVLAASEQLTVRLKVYASGGENELHAHAHEDHLFVILQGSAEFHDPDGFYGVLGPHEGVLLPKGSYYRFHVCSHEPLVMLRVGSPNESAIGLEGRLDVLGGVFDPESQKNKTVTPVFIPDRFYG